MKGIILAGGSGTRLYPLTLVTSKQLLPVYDKPMIFYPLANLMMAGIQDILIISTPSDITKYSELLGDGRQFGIRLQYAVQERPEGLAQAFLIGENFIGKEPCAMALGDNILYGGGLIRHLRSAVANSMNGCATIFGYHVNDPERFGIMEFDSRKHVLSVEEKPKKPKSNYCIIGMYFYDNTAVEMAQKVVPSPRGELEITDMNRFYLEEGRLKAEILGRGFAWFDTGTVDSLMEASRFIRMVETCQGLLICSPEEIAYRNKWIDQDMLRKSIKRYGKSAYGAMLRRVTSR